MGIGGLSMQNRFKFRVFFKYNQIMYDIDSYCFLQGLNKCIFLFANGGQKTLKNDDFILMQCTGLKDKNGKLIYEGDIVTYDWLTPISKVWRTDAKHIVEWQDGFTVIGNIAGYDVKHGKTRNVEVIGNIYQNPELLED